MSNFALICRNCWNEGDPNIDNCCVHQIDAEVIMFKCHNCGLEEYVNERKRFPEDDALLKEKEEIERILQNKRKTQRKSN